MTTRSPATDRRTALLQDLRRRQIAEAAALTPAERVAQSAELLALCDAIHPGAPTTDEPPELWLRVLASLRAKSPRRPGP